VSTSLRPAGTSRFEGPDVARLRERIVGVISNALHRDVPSHDTDLFETGILDSMAFVELLLQLELEFGVRTSAEDLEVKNFSSIARIADFVRMRAAASNQPLVASFRRGR
jgi:D-alanine--poly(phosphoribitol) ligase subunit 2